MYALPLFLPRHLPRFPLSPWGSLPPTILSTRSSSASYASSTFTTTVATTAFATAFAPTSSTALYPLHERNHDRLVW